MKALLGAWGIGNIASNSTIQWKKHAETGQFINFSIPPLSCTHPGFLEVSPLLFFDKVYVDTLQYEFFQNGFDIGYYFAPELKGILREFNRLDIVEIIDFRNIIERRIDEIINVAESILLSSEINQLYGSSSVLWNDFVVSRGGLSLPNRAGEIRLLEFYENSIAKMTKEEVAIRCSHDVFDVATMSTIADELGAIICDWQMYRPYYEFLNRSSSLLRYLPFFEKKQSVSIDYLIPIPKEMTVSNLMRLKESNYLEVLRSNERVDIKLNDPNAEYLLDMRKQIRRGLDSEFAVMNRVVNNKKVDTFINKSEKATKELVNSHHGIGLQDQRQLILRAKELIGKNRLTEVLENLMYIVVITEELQEQRNELIQLQRRLTSNQQYERNRLIDNDEIQIEYNSITYALVQICDNLVEKINK